MPPKKKVTQQLPLVAVEPSLVAPPLVEPQEAPKKKRLVKKAAVTESPLPSTGVATSPEVGNSSSIDNAPAHHPLEDPTTSSIVVIQLPINPSRIQDILQSEIANNATQEASKDPQPYSQDNKFLSNPGDLDEDTNRPKPTSVCFWCCHEIDTISVGLPIRHDVVHNTFTLFGTFCSLNCASAFNFSHHQCSERVWEINSWVHLLARNIGLSTPIRPAPSRYMLKLFGGPMTITEFRKAHQGMSRTFVQNIPPFITVNAQMEVVNTSFMAQPTTLDLEKVQQATDKVRLSRQKSVVDYKKTLDSKINLQYVEGV